MVNEDSDIAREHPEWILRTPHRMPTPARDQQVLDLTNPDAWRYLYDRIDAILTEYPIGYVKWDFNRDVVDAGRQAAPGRPDSVVGTAGVHEQTHATYRLFEALRAAHPDVEFESCSSGGGRADLGILSLTDRIWTSDCIDPLERQTIEAGTGLLVPPEASSARTSPRRTRTRPVDGTTCPSAPRPRCSGTSGWSGTSPLPPSPTAPLAQWIALYREARPLLHSGDLVRGDVADPAMLLRGVVARDQSEAVFALVQVATSLTIPSAMLRLPGLDPDRSYRVQPLAPADRTWVERWNPSWWGDVMLPGRVLGEVGLLAPAQWPEHTVLLRLTAV
ncbi:alpha-galactosidase [Salana multivorans]